MKFVPKGPIDNNPALVEIMAWRRIGDKPLSEQILTRQIHACLFKNSPMEFIVYLTHRCGVVHSVADHNWFRKWLVAYSVPRRYLNQFRYIVCFILLTGPLGTNFSENWIKMQQSLFKEIHFKMSSAKCWPFVSTSNCYFSGEPGRNKYLYFPKCDYI